MGIIHLFSNYYFVNSNDIMITVWGAPRREGIANEMVSEYYPQIDENGSPVKKCADEIFDYYNIPADFRRVIIETSAWDFFRSYGYYVKPGREFCSKRIVDMSLAADESGAYVSGKCEFDNMFVWYYGPRFDFMFNQAPCAYERVLNFFRRLKEYECLEPYLEALASIFNEDSVVASDDFSKRLKL